MDAILQVRGLAHRYNGKEVLAVDQLDIPRASITGLIGPNGSGKSTLLQLLASVLQPASGMVVFRGSTSGQGGGPARHLLCLLPQDTYLLKRTVAANIGYGFRIRGRKGDLAPAIEDALQLVGLTPSFADRQWHELSGGEAQRVALAARLILKPECLLLDEPTASVDQESAACIRRAVMRARKEWGTTLVIASHYHSWLRDICDRIIYLSNGRIMDGG